MPIPSSTESRRRRFRISVRLLMIFVLILGGGLGWIANRARVQREAVAAILRAGGNVCYADQPFTGTAAGSPSVTPDSWLMKWLREWVVIHLGDEYCRTVVRVDLEGTDIGDAEMTHVGALRGLEYLDLSDTKVTDAGVARLGGSTDWDFSTSAAPR